MAATPELKGIHKVPNEILVKIFAFVPFVPSNISSPEQPHVPSGSHDRLRQVDSRFRNVVDSPALRLETVRYQYPEVAMLRDVTNVFSADLDEFSLLDSEIGMATDKVLKEDAGDEARHAVKMGLHLLGYMSVVTNEHENDLGNAYLFAWAKKEFFSQEWLRTLRYTMYRVCSFLLATDRNYMRVTGEDLEPGTDEQDMSVVDMTTNVRRTTARRSLEAAILTQNHSGLLHKKIIAGDISGLQDRTVALYSCLTDLCLQQLGVVAGIFPSGTDEYIEEALKFVKGMHWRMLSSPLRLPAESGEDEPAEGMRGVQILRPFTQELLSDMSLVSTFGRCHVDADTSPTMKDLKEVGSFLRSAHDAIITHGAHNDLEAYIEGQNLMPSGVPIGRNGENGSEDEDDTSNEADYVSDDSEEELDSDWSDMSDYVGSESEDDDDSDALVSEEAGDEDAGV